MSCTFPRRLQAGANRLRSNTLRLSRHERRSNPAYCPLTSTSRPTRGTAGAGQVAADVSQAAVVSSPAPRSGTAEDARPALRAPRPHGHRSSESPAWSCPCRCASSCDAARPASGAHYARVDKALYQGNQFKCRDGSFVISIKQVNDDYCDCPDGSDEPGAPRSVVFWCASLDSQTPKVPLRARTARSGARTRV